MFGLMIDEGTGIDKVALYTVFKALPLFVAETSHSCTLLHCCAIKSGYASNVALSFSLIIQTAVRMKYLGRCLTSLIHLASSAGLRSSMAMLEISYMTMLQSCLYYQDSDFL
ncbi:hypothetical protein Bca101_054224 [Brassica carinata]